MWNYNELPNSENETVELLFDDGTIVKAQPIFMKVSVESGELLDEPILTSWLFEGETMIEKKIVAWRECQK